MLEDGGKVIARGTARQYTALQLPLRSASLSVASTGIGVLAGQSIKSRRDATSSPPLHFTKANTVCAVFQSRRVDSEALMRGWQPFHLFFIGLKVASELRSR